jgi:peroxiredoxin
MTLLLLAAGRSTVLERSTASLPDCVAGLDTVAAATERWDQLGTVARQAASRSDYAACVDALRQRMVLYRRHDLTLYDLACCLARAGDTAASLAVLARWVEETPRLPERVLGDPDLEAVRSLAGFAAIRQRVEATVAAGEREPNAPDHPAPGGDGCGPAVEGDDLPWLRAELAAASRRLLEARPLLGPRDARDGAACLLRASSCRLDALRRRAPGPAADDAVEVERTRLRLLARLAPTSSNLGCVAAGLLAIDPAGTVTLEATFLAEYGAWQRCRAGGDGPCAARSRRAAEELAADLVAADPDGAPLEAWAVAYGAEPLPERRQRLYRDMHRRWPDEGWFFRDNDSLFLDSRLVVDGAPPFEVETLAGEAIGSTCFRGRLLLVSLWGIWCPPCRHDIARLVALYRRYQPLGLEILGVSTDTTPGVSRDDLVAWLEEHDAEWPQSYDGLGLDGPLPRLYGTWSVPLLVLLDRDGTVLAAHRTVDAVESDLAVLLLP